VFSCKTEAELRKLKKDMMLEYDFIGINSRTEEFSSEKNNRMKEIYEETTRIHSLRGPDGPITNHKAMLRIVVVFFKNLFKKEKKKWS
jgi:hypothetical protein